MIVRGERKRWREGGKGGQRKSIDLFKTQPVIEEVGVKNENYIFWPHKCFIVAAYALH